MSKKYYVKRTISGFDEVEYLDGIQMLRGEPSSDWVEVIEQALGFDNPEFPLAIVAYLLKLPQMEFAIRREITYSVIELETKVIG
jgi:hypothetical protein